MITYVVLGVLCYNYSYSIMGTPNPILIIKAPVFVFVVVALIDPFQGTLFYLFRPLCYS